MLPKLNRRRAMFVLTKIDEILAWEKQKEAERDTRFVELGRYLCEVRAGQYWRVENVKSFDEFLERRFPESRRKAYYLMSIHEHLPAHARKELKEVGWTKGLELAKIARRDRQHFDCATWLHKAREMPKEEFKTGSREGTDRAGNRTLGSYLLQAIQEPAAGGRASARDRRLDAGDGQIPRLLPGDDLRGLPGGSESGERKSRGPFAVGLTIFQVPSRRREADILASRHRESVVNWVRPKPPRLRLDSELYEQLRNQVLRRDGFRCQLCGTKSNLEVHHKEFRSHSGDDSEQNLITLCSACHATVHHG